MFNGGFLFKFHSISFNFDLTHCATSLGDLGIHWARHFEKARINSTT